MKNKNIDKKIEWIELRDISTARQNLGAAIPLYIYRLAMFSIKNELAIHFEELEVIKFLQKAGYRAGVEYTKHMLNTHLPFDKFLSELQVKLEESKIGILRIESLNNQTGDIVLTISEDADCSGMPITGETICNYDEGFLSGILSTYSQKDYIVKEVDCWANGARVCRFQGMVKGG